MIKIQRAYDAWHASDGYRILVDRLWPRGISKEKAHIDLWLKDIAPSTALRKWFGHDPKKWDEFRKKYGEELKSQNDSVLKLKGLVKTHGTVTLVYGAKDTEHNQAVVLAELFG